MSNEIKIEKGIVRTRSAILKYPFSEMAVNDSFFVKLGSREGVSVRGSLHTMAKTWAIRNKKDWTFSTTEEKDKKQIRIWRTK